LRTNQYGSYLTTGNIAEEIRKKSHFVDSRYKEFFPGSHIISGVLCSATWMENIKRLLPRPTVSPVGPEDPNIDIQLPQHPGMLPGRLT